MWARLKMKWASNLWSAQLGMISSHTITSYIAFPLVPDTIQCTNESGNARTKACRSCFMVRVLHFSLGGCIGR
ncbi:hypothetical protein L210DRAFT_3534826 [Boletus edulis BED1]|uniref:Uncharacterized protein n=1 Tax=Boletus edulis BED1 TaxID=1328754 RepID=A0AAD4BYX9_BOLED|nr:hypothetical protein L210DRAFT_3534826 [Boletus edulis BED1]